MKTPGEIFDKIMQAYLNEFGDKKYGIEILEHAKAQWCKEFALFVLISTGRFTDEDIGNMEEEIDNYYDIEFKNPTR